MPREHRYVVYILASRSRTVYIGVTNNLPRRLSEHRESRPGAFTTRYNIHRSSTSRSLTKSRRHHP